MDQSFKKIAILPCLVLFITIVVYLGIETPVINNNKQCDLDLSLTCQFNFANQQAQQVIVKFANKVQVEELNEVMITLPADATVENIWIQGINMYMGKIAVFALPAADNINMDQHPFQFFLGSCSEANMRWQMVIQIKKISESTDSGHAETFFVNFKTDNS